MWCDTCSVKDHDIEIRLYACEMLLREDYVIL